MKKLSKMRALEKLRRLKSNFAREVREAYEFRAKSCLTCETKGACCLDAHFVNVHITRLEADAISSAISKMPEPKQEEIYRRVGRTITEYNLSAEGDTFAQTFACPLFEKGIGCLVHKEGKPLPCIQHACYENKNDVPPDDLLIERERSVERLNERTFGDRTRWLPLPIAIDCYRQQ